MTLRNMIEQGVILQGNIDITIFGEDDLTITSNYENCDKLSLNQIAKRHRDLEITHIYCEDGRLQIDLNENKNYEHIYNNFTVWNCDGFNIFYILFN